jgi:hypothetical protein
MKHYGKPALKAYEVNTSNLHCSHESIIRGYLSPQYGKTEHEARKELLSECFHYGIVETYLDEPLTYINLRIRRVPDLDKYLIDGKLRTKSEIEYQQREQEHKDKIRQMLIDHPGAYAYILKGGYYYRSNHCGYTEFHTEAGVYPMQEAVRTCLSCSYRDYMRPELVNVEAHNKTITDKIIELQSRIIS